MQWVEALGEAVSLDVGLSVRGSAHGLGITRANTRRWVEEVVVMLIIDRDTVDRSFPERYQKYELF